MAATDREIVDTFRTGQYLDDIQTEDPELHAFLTSRWAVTKLAFGLDFSEDDGEARETLAFFYFALGLFEFISQNDSAISLAFP